MGSTVYAAYEHIATAVPGTRGYGLPYTAINVFPLQNVTRTAYTNSVGIGASMLHTYLDQQESSCANQRIALVGYSQGAEVIGNVLRVLTATERSLVARVVYLGDPRFNPAISQVDRGTYNKNLDGFNGARTLAALWYPVLRDYCALHDPICNYSATNVATCGANMSTCPHFVYAKSGVAASAGDEAGSFIVALPIISPPPPVTSYAYTVYHTCANGHCGLNARTGPGYTNYAVTRVLNDGDVVNIVCQTAGEAVTGVDGSSSNIWDHLIQGDYIADFYVSTPGMTGSFSPPIPRC